MLALRCPQGIEGTLMNWEANKGPYDQQVYKLEDSSSFKRTQILVKLAPRFHGLDS
jgi:hypothetical protein